MRLGWQGKKGKLSGAREEGKPTGAKREEGKPGLTLETHFLLTITVCTHGERNKRISRLGRCDPPPNLRYLQISGEMF